MKATKKTALIAAVLGAAMAFAGCSGNSNAAGTTTTAAQTTTTASAEAADAVVKTDAQAAAPGVGDAGFTEYPIDSIQDVEVEFMNVSAVYFQPVPMTDGNSVEDYNIHLEADISALANNFGYGVGDWIPYLTVDYSIVGSNGSTAAEGTFMVMSADDGPHYGANVKLPDADTYQLTITIHSPADNNYLLHTDEETGPGAKSFDEAFHGGVLTVSGSWDYVPQEW